MGQIVPCKFQAFDAAGAPLSGGKVHTKEPGLASDKVSYSDSGLTTPNANPVILNARGEAAIFGDGNFGIILKTSADVTIWTVDNITTLTGSTYNTIYIPASAMTPTDTNGAAPGTYEFATNDIQRDYFAFDGATEQFAMFSRPMPEEWDRSTIKFKAYWSPGDSACTAGDTVEFELAAGAKSNDDAIDAAPGTGQVISDVVLAGKDGDDHITGASPALTVGGSPAIGDMIDFKVSRNCATGTDDMTEDAWLWGILIQYKQTKTVTAW